MNNFSENLREQRIKLNISQQNIASKIGVSHTQYRNYEYGKSEPTLSVIIKLCTAFDVSSDYLIGVNNKLMRMNT